ncbi:type I secretion system permease/ATPase [Bradyrhizobium sp. BRP23]|uniref:type I secretion system permease/ATPase n=1 Tax=Bradyrhizobium sp. BRP23 TaxID=2793820 RepID=UPI001CD7680B|nr:type I secretion system permease/ATPase [Bradyrhizobium sp. BRP23]MCA1379275.1 type I secretion system permease/ATPase [Bradyrhizobium sp. BRP05]MCA1420539.1 type I secretion system permease/ATPase [Bradyrhizobium sp. BRP23]
MSRVTQLKRASPAKLFLRRSRSALFAIGLFSCFINLLMLTGSFFMLQVYDRVLPSRSASTLIALGALVTGLYVFQGLLEATRSRIFVRLARSFDLDVSRTVVGALFETSRASRINGDGLQSLRDLDQVRSFLSSAGPAALFDLPWMPLYLGLCFAFHVWIGVAALIGAIVLMLLTAASGALTSRPTKATVIAGTARFGFAGMGVRHAETLHALGMTNRVIARWQERNLAYLNAHQDAADILAGFGATGRAFRMLLQSAILGLGAFLVIHQEATAGVIIASSILTARALAPVELTIAHWKGLLAARQGWLSLQAMLAHHEALTRTPILLPPPKATLSLEGVTVRPPGDPKAVVAGVSFTLRAGQGLGIIGPSGSGKSSLARAIVGVWPAFRGSVRLDEASIDQWSNEELGRHIGYVPQAVDLLAGTIAENIARFRDGVDDKMVIDAAKAAGVHEMIVRLPSGYNTVIGEGGVGLSAGQRQRIGLARALFGSPWLVVLDEPNSNLDAEGEQALTQAILQVRQREGIVIVIAHRPSALVAVDHILALSEGIVQAFGPKETVLKRITRQPASVAPSGLKVVDAGAAS